MLNSDIENKIFVFFSQFVSAVYFQEPVEHWPLCDCLISFHSKGFPLDKAIQYAVLREPFIINDLHMQYILQVRSNNVIAGQITHVASADFSYYTFRSFG